MSLLNYIPIENNRESSEYSNLTIRASYIKPE